MIEGRYVVASGVTIEVSATGDEYAGGDEISPEVFPTVAEFKGFLAAGRIVRYVPPEEGGQERRGWDYFSIDEELDPHSPNPVTNRALYALLGGQAERAEAESARLSAEETARADADSALSARMDAEEAERRAADSTLDARLSGEAAERTAAEESLSERISAEEAARADADSALSARMDAEEAGRESAVGGLSARMDGAEDSLAELSERLSAEGSARSLADEELSARIDGAERTAESLGSRIDGLRGSLDEARDELSERISAEEAARESLSARISAEEAARESAVGGISGRMDGAELSLAELSERLSAEGSARSLADEELSARIDALRENADAANTAILNAETAEIKDGNKLVKESAVWGTAFLRNPTTSTPATRSPAGYVVRRDTNVISQNYYFDKTVNLAGLSVDFSESGIRFYVLGADGTTVRSHFVAWQS